MINEQRRLCTLFVNTSDSKGGADITTGNLLQAFNARGHNTWLAVGRKTKSDPRVIQIPSITYFGKIKRKLAAFFGFGYSDYTGSWQLLRLPPVRPEIVHCVNLHGGYFDLRVLPWLSRQLPVILHLCDAWLLSGHCAHSFGCQRWRIGCGHCPNLGVYPAIKRDTTAYNWRRKRHIYAKSRLYITAPSRWLIDRAKQSMLKAVEYRAIPTGIDLSLFHPGDQKAARLELGLPVDSKIILFVANSPEGNCFKDYHTIESAVQQLAAQNIKLMFVSLGAQKTFDRSNTRFIAYEQDPKRVAQYFQAADLYVHAARAETFSRAILEALACGVPVVATAVGGIPEMIDDGLNGFLVPAYSPEAMAERIRLLISDSELRSKFSRAAAQTARSRFDSNQQADAYIDWYYDILKRWRKDK